MLCNLTELSTIYVNIGYYDWEAGLRSAVSRGHKRRNRPHKKNKKDEGTSGTKDSNGEIIPTQELRERTSNPTILEVVDLATSLGETTGMANVPLQGPVVPVEDIEVAQAGKSKELSQDPEMNQFPNREEGTLQGEFFDAQEAIESTLALAVRNSDESIIEGCEPTSRRDEAKTTNRSRVSLLLEPLSGP
ncbi:hypothetical protein IFM89_012758 [Coptis chinensis]|uniref:Uncharacterized protein n=1 Tax=Coptis chinensis TaxID=261450 RepID=A0A835LJ10_9MAGN|nr:hypothetical protein IFM89_012758 [Coptis chinensis]